MRYLFLSDSLHYVWLTPGPSTSLQMNQFHSFLSKVKVLVVQSCPTICDTMDCSRPGSSVRGILQARILEWGAIPFSRGSSRLRNWTWVSCIAGWFFTIWATRGVPFYNWLIFHCILVRQLLYPFIFDGHFRSLLYPGCCKPCCNEH